MHCKTEVIYVAFLVMILDRVLRLKQRLFTFAFVNTFFNVRPQLDCYYIRSESYPFSPPLLVKEPDIA